jgi:hypothetical protein
VDKHLPGLGILLDDRGVVYMQYITFVSPFQSGKFVDIILRSYEKGRCVGLFGALLREGRMRNREAPRRVREGLFVCFGLANGSS